MADKLFNVERPMTLDSVKGHEVVVARIGHWFETGNVPSFILSEGCRGCGKTTTARIIARYVNCDNPTKSGPCGECESCKKALAGNNLDIIELDAASKNKVEDVKGLEEKIHYMPFYKKKVVILDEVHRLSDAAFSSLLKLLEEPPEHCIFIFCTTEAQKIPDTIRSRARQLTFAALPVNVITERLKEICVKYGVNAEDEALAILAKSANGAMRDAVNYLEDFFDGDVTVERVRAGLGVPDTELVCSIIEGMLTADFKCIKAFREAVGRGVRLNVLVEYLVRTCLDVSQFLLCSDMSFISGTESYKDSIIKLSKMDTFVRFAELVKVFGSVRYVGVESYQVESIIVSAMIEESSVSVLSKKVAELESELVSLKAGRVISDVPAPVALHPENAFVTENTAVVTNLQPDEGSLFTQGIADGFVDIGDANIPFDTDYSAEQSMASESYDSVVSGADDYYAQMYSGEEEYGDGDYCSAPVVSEEIPSVSEPIQEQVNETKEEPSCETKVFAHDCDICEYLEVCSGPDECMLDKCGSTHNAEDSTPIEDSGGVSENVNAADSEEDTFSALFGDVFSFS